jgi:tetratricopeptide (TPR) repeat protein
MQRTNLVIRDDGDAMEALLARADELEEQGERLQALELLQTVESSKDPAVLARIGILLYELERWREAEAAFLATLNADAELWAAEYYLGLSYRAEGRLEEAQEALQRAVKLDESAGTLTILGVIQIDLGLKQAAQESFRKALTLDPDYEEAMYNLATSLPLESQEEAFALFERAIEIDPQYALAHRELGWLFRRTQQLPAAEYHLRRAIELNPLDGWSFIYLGNLMWEVDREAAEKAYRDAIRVWPERGVGYWCLAHFFECTGRRDEAEHYYVKALEVDPADAQANWRFGNYLKSIGDRARARYYLTNALELDPTDNRVKEALASLETDPNDLIK